MWGWRHASSATTTRWTSRVSFVRIFERYVTRFAPHLALKLIAPGELTFAEIFDTGRRVGEGTHRGGGFGAGATPAPRTPDATSARGGGSLIYIHIYIYTYTYTFIHIFYLLYIYIYVCICNIHAFLVQTVRTPGRPRACGWGEWRGRPRGRTAILILYT